MAFLLLNKLLCTYRVVDANYTIVSIRDGTRMFLGEISRNGQKDNITFLGSLHGEEFSSDISIGFRGDDLASTSFTAKNAEFGYRKLARFQALANFFTNGTGGTDNPHGQGHLQTGRSGAEGGGWLVGHGARDRGCHL